MEDLKISLSKNEFSTGRKVLLWIIASLFAFIGFWDVYLKNAKLDTNVNSGLTIVLFSISAFIFFLAILATLKRKNHYFEVTKDSISYRYGLLFSTHHSHDWEEVDKIRMLSSTKRTILILKNGKEEHINLTWIDKTNSSIIMRHIYYSAKKRGIHISRK